VKPLQNQPVDSRGNWRFSDECWIRLFAPSYLRAKLGDLFPVGGVRLNGTRAPTGWGLKVTAMAFVAVVSVVYDAECFATPLPSECEIVGPEGAFHGEVSDERTAGPVSWDQAQQDARALLEARKARRTEAVGPSAVDSSKAWRSTVADWAKDEAKVKYPW